MRTVLRIVHVGQDVDGNMLCLDPKYDGTVTEHENETDSIHPEKTVIWIMEDLSALFKALIDDFNKNSHLTILNHHPDYEIIRYG